MSTPTARKPLTDQERWQLEHDLATALAEVERLRGLVEKKLDATFLSLKAEADALRQRAEGVEAEVERLRLEMRSVLPLENHNNIVRDLRQRAEAAEAEVEREKQHRAKLIVDIHNLRQRAEAAEAEAEQVKSEMTKLGHRYAYSRESNKGLRAHNKEVNHALTNKDRARLVNLRRAELAEAKLAEAQQREAWWRELYPLALLDEQTGRETELRRLLGLDAPEEDR